MELWAASWRKEMQIYKHTYILHFMCISMFTLNQKRYNEKRAMSRALGSLFVQRWGSASAIALDSFLEYSQNTILSATKIHIFISTNFQISSSDKLFLKKFTNLNPPCQKNSMERKCVGWRTGTRTSAQGCSTGCVYISTLPPPWAPSEFLGPHSDLP